MVVRVKRGTVTRGNRGLNSIAIPKTILRMILRMIPRFIFYYYNLGIAFSEQFN